MARSPGRGRTDRWKFRWFSGAPRSPESPMPGTRPLLIGLALAMACHGQSVFRGDTAHTGIFAGSGPRQFHRVKWRFATGDRVVSSPVWAAGVIYFGSDDGNVYAVDAETGLRKWTFVTRGPVPCTPAIANGLVYFASYDGHLYAVEADTGRLRWKFSTGGERRFEA